MSNYIPSIDVASLRAPFRVYCDVDGVCALFYTEYDLNKIIVEGLDVNSLGNSYVRLNDCVFNNKAPRQVDVFWKSQNMEALSQLSHRDDVDFVWLTTWRHEAPNNLDKLFNIKSAGYLNWVVNLEDNLPEMGKSKSLLETETVAPSQKFVWIDDAAISNQAEQLLTDAGLVYETVKPHNVDGILVEDILMINKFFKEGK